jgi:hypothetical protein
MLHNHWMEKGKPGKGRAITPLGEDRLARCPVSDPVFHTSRIDWQPDAWSRGDSA